MKFYTHKTTSIFVIDVKFHKNPLFRLRDVQFFKTAVTNLSYRYNLLLADVIFLVTGAMETHDLWVVLFKNSYFSKVKADLYETM